MATYYNYVERTADSQINWAEVGKNMTDMLQQETKVREQKKAAIDAASRQFGQVLANSPQGEHVGAREAALKFGDNASQYMLMQDRLLKSGNLNLKDYTINRQNLLDGTDNAFNALKDFQEVYAKKMERARTSKSSLYEVRKMEQAEGFGDFSKIGFYINPTNGVVNVAKKTKKNIDGNEVYAMDETPGEFASINYVKGLIKGEWDKFDSNAVTDTFAKGLGDEMKSIQSTVATLSRTGEIKTISDITSRTDIDPETKKVMFKFIDAENQMIDGALANPFNRASVLTDNNVSAPNGKLYDITTDPEKAKANPNLILEVIDPATGMGTLKFTPEQIKISQDFMRNQARAKYDYKEEVRATPQLELRERRAPTPPEIDAVKKKEEAKIFGENLATALVGKNPEDITNSVKYLANKAGKIFNRTADGFFISNLDGSKPTTFSFTTSPAKLTKSLISAFGSDLPEGTITEVANKLIGSNPIERKTLATGFDVVPKKVNPVDEYNQQVDAVVVNSPASKLANQKGFADELNKTLGKFGYTAKTTFIGNDVYLVDNKNKSNKSPDFTVTKNATTNKSVLQQISDWIKKDLESETPEETETKASIKLKSLGVGKTGGVGSKYNTP